MASEPPSRSLQKAKHLFGVARIDLDKLRFDDAVSNDHRRKSRKVQAKLLDVFELEGCQRTEQEHFIDALITRECLSEALVAHGKTIETFRELGNPSDGFLRDVIWLKPMESLRCLNGLHRIAAAKQFLDKNDRWWTVRLYEKQHFEADLTTHIQEAFGHEQHYSDGIIFRNIRRYHHLADEANEKKWWARLTASKKRDLKQLLKDRHFVHTFDSLIDLPGLWPPVQLGTLHRQHSLRCTEEMISYLEHVRDVWHTMIPQDCRESVDEHTACQLEMLAPAMSRSDSEKVEELFKRQQVFSAVTDPSRRAILLQAIQSQRCLIPTLRTFFENQKYLEPCSMILKALLDDTDRRSLWQSFRANFFQPESVRLQLSNSVDNLTVLGIDSSDQIGVALRLGYIQLWMFCFRHFPEMTPIKPRLEARNGHVSQRPINPSLMPQLARLAVKLGFQTDKAMALANEDPERLAVEEFVRSARPGHGEDVSDHVLAIKHILKQISNSPQATSKPAFLADRSLVIERRCGRPFENDYVQERQALFAPLVYCGIQSGVEFTSLYARTDAIKSFFSHCIPADNTISQNVLGALAVLLEQQPVSNAPVEQPVAIGTTNMQRIRDDLEHCNTMRSQDADQVRALAEELAQARDELQQLRNELQQATNELQSVNRLYTSLKSDYTSLQVSLSSRQREIEAKDGLIAEKDKTIAEKERALHDVMEENIDLMSAADAPLEEHHNGNIESDYNQLKELYHRVEAQSKEDRRTRERLEAAQTTLHDQLLQEQKKSSEVTTRKTAALQEEIDRLIVEVQNLQSQARRSEADHNQALDDRSTRIQQLERQQTSRAFENKHNKAIQIRHRRTDFPFRQHPTHELYAQFEIDIQTMIERRLQYEDSAEYLRVWEIAYDEEGLGFTSRLFRIRKEVIYVKEFIDGLKERQANWSSEPLVFDFCIEHEEDRIQFQRLLDIGQGTQATDTDVRRLIDLDDQNRPIFYGLRKDDSDLFRWKFRDVGGLRNYNKRKRDDSEMQSSTNKRLAPIFAAAPLQSPETAVAGDVGIRPQEKQVAAIAATEGQHVNRDPQV